MICPICGDRHGTVYPYNDYDNDDLEICEYCDEYFTETSF